MAVRTDSNGNKVFHTTITISESLYREAKLKRIPLSFTLEEALRAKLGRSIVDSQVTA